MMKENNVSGINADPRIQPGAVLRHIKSGTMSCVLMQVAGPMEYNYLVFTHPGAKMPYLRSTIDILARMHGAPQFELVEGPQAEDFRAQIAAADLQATLAKLPKEGQAEVGYVIGMAYPVGNGKWEVSGPYYTGATDRGRYWSLSIDDGKIYDHQHQADFVMQHLQQNAQSDETVLGVREVWRFSPADFSGIGQPASEVPKSQEHHTVIRIRNDILSWTHWSRRVRHDDGGCSHEYSSSLEEAGVFSSRDLAEEFIRKNFPSSYDFTYVAMPVDAKAQNYEEWMARGLELHKQYKGSPVGNLVWTLEYGSKISDTHRWESFPTID